MTEARRKGVGRHAAALSVAERPRRLRVTMREVARAAGVSIQTVSNVVNGRSSHMTPETESRVSKVIEELGFRPNPSAQGLRLARTQTLSFIVLDPSPHFLADPMTDLFLSGLGEELRERSCGLLISSDIPGVPLQQILEPVVGGRADGAVIFLSGDPELRQRYLVELRAIDQPCILLQEHGTGENDIPAVCADDRAGSLDLCRHLISAGHERIGFLTASHSWSAIEERMEGYLTAHLEAGLELQSSLVRRAGDFTPLGAAAASGDLLDLHPRVTAVMCGNDLIALGVAKAARDRGLSIPGDLAITGFDNFDFAAAVDPPLTTVRIPGYEMGRYAANALLEAVDKGDAPVGRDFSTEVFLRGST